VGYDLQMSYTNLLYHIVYGTKDRLPLITKELRPELHPFLGGLVNDLHGTPLVCESTFAIRRPIIQEFHLRTSLRLY